MVKDQLTDTEAARQAKIYNITNEVFNSLSMFSALLVICAISYLRIKHKNISNRVSLRLQTYVSISDLLFAAFQIMTVNSYPPGNWVCHVAPWGFVFTALLGCFFTCMIALNLQIIFIHNYINTHRFEKFYIIIPILLAFTLSITPVIFDALGYDEKEVSCWYKNGSTAGAIVWQWTTLHGWIILSVLYCTYTVLIIIIRLRKTSKRFINMNNSFLSTSPSNSNRNRLSYKRQIMINQAVKRILLYPTVPIISFCFNIISNLLFFTTKESHFEFQMLANVGTGSQGLLNAMAFCFDPAMRKIWNEIFKNFLKLFNNNNGNDDGVKNHNSDDDDNKDDDEDNDDYDNGRDNLNQSTVTVVKGNQSNTTSTLYSDDNLNHTKIQLGQEGKEGIEGNDDDDDTSNNNIISLL